MIGFLGKMGIRTRILMAPLAAIVPLVFSWIGYGTGLIKPGSIWLSVGFPVLAVALSIITALMVAKTIITPIRLTVDRIRNTGGGDLTQHFDLVTKDEMGEMSHELTLFVKKFSDILVQFWNGSSLVSNKSSILSGNLNEMIKSLEAAVFQVNSVATASEEMSGTAMEIARNCGSAAKSAEQANEAAVHGETIVNGTVALMDRINSIVKASAKIIEELGNRSDQIGEVISLINDIADQTNLLALNAAIEAARAGEHGRGFAVVADEVRKLAEKTTGATKDIGNTIKAMQSEAKQAVVSMDQGVKEVELGAEEAKKSGAALKNILQQINAVSSEIGQIAVASEQQTATIDEIASNIQHVSIAIETTTKSAEKNVSAASEMENNTANLNLAVRFYKIATIDDARELVRDAVAYYKAHGKEKTFAEINSMNERFQKKGLAVLGVDFNGTIVAAGQDQRAMGMNLLHMKDAKGKEFVKECISVARTRGDGYCDYVAPNPLTQELQERTSYYQRAGSDDYYFIVDVAK